MRRSGVMLVFLLAMAMAVASYAQSKAAIYEGWLTNQPAEIQRSYQVDQNATEASLILASTGQGYTWPILGGSRISSEYAPCITPDSQAKYCTSGGRKHPINGELKAHQGTDIASRDVKTCAAGALIIAPKDGIVSTAKYTTNCVLGDESCGGGYGNRFYLEHPDGLTTHYTHMAKVLVNRSAHVKQGDVIGIMGTTGSSTGKHIHFEVKKSSRFLDPMKYIDQKQVAQVEVVTSNTVPEGEENNQNLVGCSFAMEGEEYAPQDTFENITDFEMMDFKKTIVWDDLDWNTSADTGGPKCKYKLPGGVLTKKLPACKVTMSYVEPTVMVEVVENPGFSNLQNDITLAGSPVYKYLQDKYGDKWQSRSTVRGVSGRSASATNFNVHVWGLTADARFDSSGSEEEVRKSMACDLAEVWPKWDYMVGGDLEKAAQVVESAVKIVAAMAACVGTGDCTAAMWQIAQELGIPQQILAEALGAQNVGIAMGAINGMAEGDFEQMKAAGMQAVKQYGPPELQTALQCQQEGLTSDTCKQAAAMTIAVNAGLSGASAAAAAECLTNGADACKEMALSQPLVGGKSINELREIATSPEAQKEFLNNYVKDEYGVDVQACKTDYKACMGTAIGTQCSSSGFCFDAQAAFSGDATSVSKAAIESFQTQGLTIGGYRIPDGITLNDASEEAQEVRSKLSKMLGDKNEEVQKAVENGQSVANDEKARAALNWTKEKVGSVPTSDLIIGASKVLGVSGNFGKYNAVEVMAGQVKGQDIAQTASSIMKQSGNVEDLEKAGTLASAADGTISQETVEKGMSERINGWVRSGDKEVAQYVQSQIDPASAAFASTTNGLFAKVVGDAAGDSEVGQMIASKASLPTDKLETLGRNTLIKIAGSDEQKSELAARAAAGDPTAMVDFSVEAGIKGIGDKIQGEWTNLETSVTSAGDTLMTAIKSPSLESFQNVMQSKIISGAVTSLACKKADSESCKIAQTAQELMAAYEQAQQMAAMMNMTPSQMLAEGAGKFVEAAMASVLSLSMEPSPEIKLIDGWTEDKIPVTNDSIKMDMANMFQGEHVEILDNGSTKLAALYMSEKYDQSGQKKSWTDEYTDDVCQKNPTDSSCAGVWGLLTPPGETVENTGQWLQDNALAGYRGYWYAVQNQLVPSTKVPAEVLNGQHTMADFNLEFPEDTNKKAKIGDVVENWGTVKENRSLGMDENAKAVFLEALKDVQKRAAAQAEAEAEGAGSVFTLYKRTTCEVYVCCNPSRWEQGVGTLEAKDKWAIKKVERLE